MWVRKSPSEIQREKADLLGPILKAVGMGVFLALAIAMGSRGAYDLPDRPIPLDDWPIFVPALTLLFSLFSLPFFVYLRRSKFSESNDRLCLCVQCFTPQCGNPSKRCACGGSLDAMWKWKWIDDLPNDSEPGADRIFE